MIEINYIATGGYIKYFNLFKDTIKYFFPKEEKYLRIITDSNVDICNIDKMVVKTEVIKMFNLIYPCINLNKTYILSQLPSTNAEYVFYFDADTYFNEMAEIFWENFKQTMDDGYFCISSHPFYSLSDDDDYKDRDIEVFFSCMTERDKTQNSYIDSYYYTYIISSFFCAKRDIFFTICEEVTSLIRGDMKRDNYYRIPLYMDENYFNKLVYEYQYKGNDKHKFSVREYILLGNGNNKKDLQEAFITQKNYNQNFKTNRQ